MLSSLLLGRAVVLEKVAPISGVYVPNHLGTFTMLEILADTTARAVVSTRIIHSRFEFLIVHID